ncbi:MAG: hypothetical protein RL722_1380 [Pseudomonadota bacterium]|jgi:cell division protein FtsI (penicillin-binding protein 3)
MSYVPPTDHLSGRRSGPYVQRRAGSAGGAGLMGSLRTALGGLLRGLGRLLVAASTGLLWLLVQGVQKPLQRLGLGGVLALGRGLGGATRALWRVSGGRLLAPLTGRWQAWRGRRDGDRGGRAAAHLARAAERSQRSVRAALAAGAVGSAGNANQLRYASSPLLASRTPLWRSRFIVFGVGLGFVALVARALYIQVLAAGFYIDQGEIRTNHTQTLPARRGRILDRNGLQLAASVAVSNVWVSLREFKADEVQRARLAQLLGIAPAELAAKLDAKLAAKRAEMAEEARRKALKRALDEGEPVAPAGDAATRKPSRTPDDLRLARGIDTPVVDQLKALRIPGLYVQPDFRRHYPEGEAIAQVVGFTDLEGAGLEGLELHFDQQLRGRNGSRAVVRDRLGNVVEDLGEQAPTVDGKDITLSIDSKLQFFAYQAIRNAVSEHRAKAGSVVVLDSTTGELLALANYPSYAPGDRGAGGVTPAQMRNRGLTDTFEPGSTMKPFIAGLALQTGRVRPDTVIQTAPGRHMVTGVTISDAHPHGALTVEQVIQKSSNVGTVKMAMQMQPREMWGVFSAVGFGAKPDLPFPGLAGGRLRPAATWRPIEQATMSYGYGLSTSLYQLARAYTVFAHDGELMPARLEKVDRSQGPVVGTRVFQPEVARSVRKMLGMVTGEGGTAPKAQTPGYSVGGKTGTAHKQEGGAYAGHKYRSWFVGLAPLKNPRLVVAVMVDEPTAGKYFGGDVAAPVFSTVVGDSLRLLGEPLDLEVKSQIVTRQIEAEQESF